MDKFAVPVCILHIRDSRWVNVGTGRGGGTFRAQQRVPILLLLPLIERPWHLFLTAVLFPVKRVCTCVRRCLTQVPLVNFNLLSSLLLLYDSLEILPFPHHSIDVELLELLVLIQLLFSCLLLLY